MAELSAKSFLNLVERSGIVPGDRLKSTLTDLSKQVDGQVVTVDQLANCLIENELITPWHSQKLLGGKYKGFFIGKYKLLGHLGTGGMSSVYLAEHKVSGQKRAIKVLPRKKVDDTSYLDRFYREGKAAASLNHPNICRVFDICNEKGTHFMVMEYMQGRDFYEIVSQDGPMDFVDAARYVRDAASGLHHAHARNLVHRDIKPANLFLTDSGTVKVLDLGLALLQEEEESLTVMYNEKVMGTADYLSPEQAVNSHEVDHRADIYSLGCTFYYMLTGHPPFPEGTLAQRIAMHQSTEPKHIHESRPDCPELLIRICQKMMTKDADQRLQDCEQVQQVFDAYLNGEQLAGGSSAPASNSGSSGSAKLDDAPETDSSTGNLEPQFSIDTRVKPDSTKKQKKPSSIKSFDTTKTTGSASGKWKTGRKKQASPVTFLFVAVGLMAIALILVMWIAMTFAI